MVHALRGLLRRDELPSGCPFQPRCAYGEPACATTHQVLETIDKGHDVACQRWPAIAPELPSSDEEDQALPPADGEPLFRFDAVSLSYDVGTLWRRFGGAVPTTVVSDASFELGRGETLALVGESGSGKSTIARAAAGILPPLAGKVMFKGEGLPPRVERRSGGAASRNPVHIPEPRCVAEPACPHRSDARSPTRDVLRSPEQGRT